MRGTCNASHHQTNPARTHKKRTAKYRQNKKTLKRLLHLWRCYTDQHIRRDQRLSQNLTLTNTDMQDNLEKDLTPLHMLKPIKFPATQNNYTPTSHNNTDGHPDSSLIKSPAPPTNSTPMSADPTYQVNTYIDDSWKDIDWINAEVEHINAELDTYLADKDDELVIVPNETASSFTAYKRVDKKIHPISTRFPDDCHIKRQITDDPLLTLPLLTPNPPPFAPTKCISEERLKILDINGDKFLAPEEERLFQHIMVLNERGIAFEDVERGTLKEEYFSPYIIPTVPHQPWEDRNIPIPPGLRDKVIEVLKLKIDAGVYEQSQSSYRSQWFVTVKKSGKLRIVHDLQPLNQIAIRDAGSVPILDDFVEGFAGRQCYTVFDLFWGFDARKIHP